MSWTFKIDLNLCADLHYEQQKEQFSVKVHPQQSCNLSLIFILFPLHDKFFKKTPQGQTTDLKWKSLFPFSEYCLMASYDSSISTGLE